MAVSCAPLIFEDLYGLWILEANLRHVYSVLGLSSSNYLLGIYLVRWRYMSICPLITNSKVYEL